MLKFARNFVLTLLFCAVAAPQMLAQFHPLPGAKTEPAVICSGCPGENASRQTNDGLPTYPYSGGLVDHVGRYVDSSSTANFQHIGYRTARARTIKIADTRRGSAPPRAYIQIGNGIGVYSLDTFFSTRLPGGMVPINKVVNGIGGFQRPPEKILQWDAVIYPEGSTDWDRSGQDIQDPMGKGAPIDFDDRGYVYSAHTIHGWGVALDDGTTTGAHLKRIVQFKNSLTYKEDKNGKPILPLTLQYPNTKLDTSGVSPESIVAVKVGTKYYAIVANRTGERAVYDVTDVANGRQLGATASDKTGKYAIRRADRSDDYVATVDAKYNLQIWTAADLANNGEPMATYPGENGGFVDVVFDESGNIWAAEKGGRVWKLARSGSSFVKQVFPAAEAFSTLLFNVGAGHVALGGIDASNNYNVRLFRAESTALKPVELDDFFKKYYFSSPAGYAQPGTYTSIESQSADLRLMRWNGKSYLMYSGYGIGDVFEIQGGNAITIATRNTYGTVNPNAKPTQNGPFFGDIVTFVANSSSSEASYDVTWNFGNPESGANTGQSRTGEEEKHQYTGLTTAAQINAVKPVKAVTVQDSNIQATHNLTLKLPVARVGVLGTNTAITASANALDFVAGDKFTDASDGVIEGHYSSWVLDGAAPVKQRANETFAVGGIGAHTLAFHAGYGLFDANLNNPSAYLTPTITLGYVVKPFKVTLDAPTAVGNDVKFTAKAVYSAADVTAANWNVNWTLNGNPVSAGAIGTNAVQSVAVGTIPALVVPKSQLPDGAVIGLSVTVDPAGLSTAALPYKEFNTSTTVSTPDPLIEVTGCENAGSACKFTAKSVSNKSQTGWTYLWTLTRPGGNPLTGTGATFEPAMSAPGSYSVTLKASKDVFAAEVSKQLTVAGSLCGPLPTGFNAAINKDSCGSGCAPGTTVTFTMSFIGYTRQACDTMVWTIEGQTYNGESATHTFNNLGTIGVTMTMTNSGSTAPLVETTNVIVRNNSGGGDPGTGTCTAPPTASFTYSGSSGCTTNGTCRTSDVISFVARRGTAQLQTCDNVLWDFGGGVTSTSRTPTHQFSNAGTYPVKLTISNSLGSREVTQDVTVTAPTTGNCTTAPAPANFVIEYKGATSGCDQVNKANCTNGESVAFSSPNYFYPVGTCDSFLWTFGDGTTSTERNPTHTFAGGQTYTVSLKVSNSAGNYTYTRTVPFLNQAPTKPVPTITATTFPSTGHKGRAVMFTATSNLPTTNNWTWNFGDGSANVTQSSVSQTSTVTHTFTKNGTFTVKATASNSEETISAKPVGTAQAQITITEAPAIPEYKFLLPVTAYTAGQGGSAWRTDVQIYHSDPQVSETKPLVMEATFKGITKTLTLIKATHIYEDFLGNLLDHQKEDQGPVIITTKSSMTPPQIWTRTYTQTANGTFGQYIPAIRIDNLGGAGAVLAEKYYMSGLRHDARYRTNVGFLNPNALPMVATVTVYDASKFKIGEFPLTLQPFQLDQFALKNKLAALPDDEPFSIKIDVPAGQWLIGYCSFIDGFSNDPVYIQAIPESDVASADYKTTVLPGVGHTGQWRSDVTIFNPDPDGVMFDLQYYDANGVKKGEALNVPLDSGKFLQYGDVLKQGVLGSEVPDGLGTLKVVVKDNHEKYPMVFARTYFDNGANGTYGQGIPGFSAARPNVKAGKHAIIAGVRNSSAYKTNIGLMNVSNAPVTATVTLLDPTTGAAVSSIPYTLQPNQTIVGAYNGWGAITQGTFKIEATGALWAFASIVDLKTFDPEYVSAIPIP
ncbi:MAG TPA: PKD domain-containing protein [Thermoanaerobaculia bacterium]